MKTQLSIILTVISLTACNQTQTQTQTQTPPPPPPESILTPPTTPSNLSKTPKPSTSSNNIITSQEIGIAKLGMTLGELKQKLGTTAQFKTQKPYIVDFDAIEVIQNKTGQYYILYPAGETLKDTEKINFLLTDNPAYKTDKQIGPGTTIKQAEEIYGKPTLSYNIDNEGREIVRFANQPKNLIFSLGNANDGSLSGLYSKVGGAYHETNKYLPNAKIRNVIVSCPPANCP